MQNWELGVGKPVVFSLDDDFLVVNFPAPPHTFSLLEMMAGKVFIRAKEQGVYRVILELSQQDMLPSVFIGQIIALEERLKKHDGNLRLCGLTKNALDDLETMQLSDRFPNYADLSAAKSA